jgi:hypothetical protein
MGQAALPVFLGRPRIGEVEVNPVNLRGSKYLTELGGIYRQKTEIAETCGFGLLGGHDDDVGLTLYGNVAALGHLTGALNAEAALSAADLKIQRGTVSPVSAPLSGLGGGKIFTAGIAACIDIFLFSHSHKNHLLYYTCFVPRGQ